MPFNFYSSSWSGISVIIHQIHNPEWGVRKHISNSIKLKVNCSIIIQIIIQKTCEIYNNLQELI